MQRRSELSRALFKGDKQTQKVGYLLIAFIFLVMAGYYAYTTYFVSYTGKVLVKYTHYVRSKHGGHTEYILEIGTKDGKVRKVSVPSELYYHVSRGTWIKKARGQYEPRIVSSP